MASRSIAASIFALSLALILYELILTRVFAIVMFAQFAHFAISLALLGVGVGALLLHLYPRLVPDDDDDGFSARLGWLAIAMAASMVVAVTASVQVPLTRVTDDPLDDHVQNFLSRQKMMVDLVRTPALVGVVLLLALPFAFAGTAFAAAFRRARESIGLVYAADLSGGALGCVLFLPVLAGFRGPDGVAVCALAACVAAWVAACGSRRRAPKTVAAVLVALCLVALVAARQRSLLQIHQAAGFDERGVVEEVWTPLARLAVFENANLAFVMLDNTSRSEVLLTKERHRVFARNAYSIVFSLVRPPTRMAVLAAGAGPDIVTALEAGHQDITAIDLAPEFFEIMRRRYRGIPVNPYLSSHVRTFGSDARSFMMRDRRRYDIIEMSQANFYSYGGMLAQAWQAALLTTREAFGSYLAHLTKRGMISIFSASGTSLWGRNAAAALRARGVGHPLRYMALVTKPGTPWQVLLVKKRPFTHDEVDRLGVLVRSHQCRLNLNPRRPARGWRAAFARGQRVLTDDRPYWDEWAGLVDAGKLMLGMEVGPRTTIRPVQILQKIMLLQVAVLFVAGAVLFGLPLLWRGRRELGVTRGAGPVLAYFAAIGYGYLGVEIVLLHELVLFVGHPTYAITLVIFTLLVSSGAGSLFAGRIATARVGDALVLALGCVLALASAHAFVLGPIMTKRLLGLSLSARAAVVGGSLLPLGFAMGMSFPLATRRMGAAATTLVPWCWAVNGWMSVVAAVVTVFIARLEGYRAAFVVSLAAYALAIVLSRTLPLSAPRTGGIVAPS